VCHREIKEEVKRFPGVNENENTTYQNLQNTAKAVLFIPMSTYIKRTERFQINDLMLYHKFLEKKEQAQPKTSRKREIIRSKINEMETKKIQRTNKTKSHSLKK
jgi:hypothetical protein